MLSDLRTLLDNDGPFFTALLPLPSDASDAEEQFAIRWRNVRKRLSGSWSQDILDKIGSEVMALPHGEGASLALVCATDGSMFHEFLAEPVTGVEVKEGRLPSLAPIIEARQRTLPHIVVEADRAGADLLAFDGGAVIEQESVEGDTLHIHRGHPGGWSQRRFQQRAENTWESNAKDVADAVLAMRDDVDARLVAVAGEVRAVSLILDELTEKLGDSAVKVEAGDPDGIAEEVVRLVADVHASDIAELAEQLRTQHAAGTATVDSTATLEALREHRVGTLLVHDDWSNDATTDFEIDGIPAGTRLIDAAVAIAIRSDADVTVVPTLPTIDGPVGALLRW